MNRLAKPFNWLYDWLRLESSQLPQGLDDTISPVLDVGQHGWADGDIRLIEVLAGSTGVLISVGSGSSVGAAVVQLDSKHMAIVLSMFVVNTDGVNPHNFDLRTANNITPGSLSHFSGQIAASGTLNGSNVAWSGAFPIIVPQGMSLLDNGAAAANLKYELKFVVLPNGVYPGGMAR